MVATVSPAAYWSAVVVTAVGCVGLSLAARRRPGPWRELVARGLGALLLADAASYTVALVLAGSWSATTDLPLALCNVTVVVAATACLWHAPLLVELTYFWGLAGTIQGLLTPDLNVAFPHLVFLQYVVGHAGVVLAAVFLVVGMRLEPRPGAVPRVFALSAAYTALVGVVDASTGANDTFLGRPPGEWTLLRLLGPWPWYVASTALVALVLFCALDAPLWRGRRWARATAGPGRGGAHGHA